MSELKNTIQHQEAQHRFVLSVDGQEAILAYRMRSETVIDFHHTYVPDELRGQNIAAQLVECGLQYAKEREWQVVPSCSYVQRYMERHTRKTGV